MTGAARRNRLYSLWASLTDPRMDQCLERDTVVPSRFLTDHNITLVRDDFSSSQTAEDSLNKEPPVLLLPRPTIIVTGHPVDYDNKFWTPMMRVDPSPTVRVKQILDREWMPFYRGMSLARYLDHWAMGGYPRCFLPPRVPDLATLCGIHDVAYVPSASGYGFVAPV